MSQCSSDHWNWKPFLVGNLSFYFSTLHCERPCISILTQWFCQSRLWSYILWYQSYQNTVLLLSTGSRRWRASVISHQEIFIISKTRPLFTALWWKAHSYEKLLHFFAISLKLRWALLLAQFNFSAPITIEKLQKPASHFGATN